MHDHEPAAANRSKSVRRWLWIGSLIVLVAGSPPFALWLGYTNQKRQIDREIARIRAAGEPVTIQDLQELYAVPPKGDDATQAWLKALSALPPPGSCPENNLRMTFQFHTSPSPSQLKASEAFLNRNSAAMDLLYEAAEQDGSVRYPIEFDSNGWLRTRTHLADLRWCAQLLELDAYIRRKRGDDAGVARAIQAIFRAARTLKREPSESSQRTRFDLDRQGLVQVQWMLRVGRVTDNDLRQLQESIREIDYADGAYRAMLAGRVRTILFAQGLPILPDFRRIGSRDSNSLFWNSDARLALESMRPIIEATRLTPLEAEKRLQTVKDALDAVDLKEYRLLDPWFDNKLSFLKVVKRDLARWQAADAAIAVALFRIRHDRMPTGLQELVPAFLSTLPIDPFSHDTMKFAIKRHEYADEYVVYSVGANGTDDGGRERGVVFFSSALGSNIDDPTDDIGVSILRHFSKRNEHDGTTENDEVEVDPETGSLASPQSFTSPD